MEAFLRRFAVSLLVSLISIPATLAAEQITYYHWDATGSPVAATDEQGNVVWRKSYKPYGEETQTPPTPAESRSFTGHVLDADTGLLYAGARYYDPTIGRFMAVDPANFVETNPHSFNKYAYGNNNPYKYVDPDGKAAVLVLIPPVVIGGAYIYYSATPEQRAQMGRAFTQMGENFQSNVRWLGDKVGSLARPLFNESSEGTNNDNGNTNPYDGPVGEPVVVVDPKGNAIPVGQGQWVTGSPDGRWVQVRDKQGNPTGTRLDGGHKPSTHPDPRAQEPHAHVPGVTNPDGTPWLPVNR